MKDRAEHLIKTTAYRRKDVAEIDTALRGPVITAVNLVDLIERGRNFSFKAVSLPGHLIQFVLSGEVAQTAGGITERFKTGDAVWYHENEPLEGRVIRAPWRFITVNFDAPTLAPPPAGKRVKKTDKQTAILFRKLLRTWNDKAMSPVRRHLSVHSMLNALIASLLADRENQQQADESTKLWWKIENDLRSDLSKRITLSFLGKYTHLSLRTIIRSCKAATGLSPMKRLKKVRLSYARGLVQFSGMNMSEIAYRIGYGRVQEFSRDYALEYKRTPTRDRQAGPDYRAAKPK